MGRKKKLSKKKISLVRLEVAVEDLYDTLSRNGLVDWKSSFSHPLATVEQYESNAMHDRLDQLTIDIDLLRLRVESAIERKQRRAKKQRK